MNTIQEEQISTKELFKKIIGVFKTVMSEWKFVLIMAGVISLSSILYDYTEYQERQYGAEVVFNLELNGGGGGGMGDLGGLAGAFGLGGGGRATDFFSNENFLPIISSKAVYERALMKEVKVYGKKMLFVNYYKDSSDIAKKEWGGDFFNEPNYELIKYRFEKKKPEEFTLLENVATQQIYEKLKKGTETRSLGKGTSLTSLIGITNNEMLSKIWVETLLETMEEFYKEVKTKRSRQVLAIQESRLDSLRRVMLGTDRQLASVTAQNVNAVDPSGQMRQQQLNRSNNFISNQYFAQLTTVENLRLMMINQTPIFTVLEPVRLPLLEYNWYIGQKTTPAAFIGLILGVIIVLLRKFFKELSS
jgi:hypothetical protein